MDDNSTGIPKKKDIQSYELSGKVMLFSVVTLILFLLLILLFHFSRCRRRPSAAALPFSFCRRGLDSSTLNSIPTFTYAAAAHPKLLDCAVCLSDFEDGESGRVLPNCRHCFHVHCIDAWFKSHSNCPLCRSPVNPTPTEIVIPVGQFSSAGSDPRSAGALAPVECRRKSPELQGWFGLRRESEPGEGGSGSRDPESGVLALKRLLTLEHMAG